MSKNALAQILGLGFAFPSQKYTQLQLAKALGVENPKAQRFFLHEHIETRYLHIPESFDKKPLEEESTGQLLNRFKSAAVEDSIKAMQQALKNSNSTAKDIDFLCCVTSTGYLVPGLSALIIAATGLKPDCERIDVVGMGCNAGLNGLNCVANWCASNPEKKAMLICCEISSAIYSFDQSEETALVNSLFADGTAAAILTNTKEVKIKSPAVLGFQSYIIPDSLSILRFDWDDLKHRFKFHVGKEAPKFLAESIETPIKKLLRTFKVEMKDVRHWILHSGGAAILDGIEARLNLKKNDLRHTRSVLKAYGNISSGSFLLSLNELIKEDTIEKGDTGILITMGPGLTIETALIRWN